MRVRAWGVLVCIALGCATAPSKPPATDFAAVERARIAELELARDTRGEVLVSRARLHADPTVRARALLALGRVRFLAGEGGTAATQRAATRVVTDLAANDPDPVIRAAAAAARDLTVEQHRMQ